MQRKYELELWINNVLVADISRLAKDRSYTITRNEREELSFKLDVTAFEEYCEGIGSEPVEVLEPYVTDVRVKRNGKYLFGVQVVDMAYDFSDAGKHVTVRCTGFIDLFMDRYITANYSLTDATEISKAMIELTQSEMGTMGVGFGYIEGSGVLRDRNYTDQNVKDAIINLTNLIDGNFDFKFLADRTYETYKDMGKVITGLKFTYPYNVQKMTVPRSATNLHNYIIALGSGFGEETLRSEAGDTESRANYGTRQKILSFNSVSEQSTLNQHAVSEVLLRKNIIMLPKITVTGDVCDLNSVWVADRVQIEVQGIKSLPLDGMFKIEQITCNIDDNDAETIDLVVDNYGI